MRQLTETDICKLIEELAKDNEIIRLPYLSLSWTYSISKLIIELYKDNATCIYDGFEIFSNDNENLIRSTIHRIIEERESQREQKVFKEILNIIHNDKEATNS